MGKKTLDTIDNEIIRLLTKDGRMPIGELAKKLNVTAPTLRKRIRALEEDGIFKVSGLINSNRYKEMLTALVGMRIESEGKLDQVLEEIESLPNVSWAAVVTGRYDIIAEVICVEGQDELYRFTTQTVLQIGRIVQSETFMYLKSINNWVRMPEK